MSDIEDYVSPGAQGGYVASLGERVWGLGLGKLTTPADCAALRAHTLPLKAVKRTRGGIHGRRASVAEHVWGD
jgi:hypothetical protein